MTAPATLQALGLSAGAAAAVSSLAKAGADLLAAKLADPAGTPRSLVANVVAAATVAQGVEAADVAAAAGSYGAVAGKYSGGNLAAQVDASKAQQAGTPYAIAYTDTTAPALGYTNGDAYAGPVALLQRQYIWGSGHNVALAASTGNVFLHGGTGNDALSVSGGTNVLDGGTGSNFLTGGTGAAPGRHRGGTGADGGMDTFFVDGRSGGVTWSTINNFHHGDAVTVWGFTGASGRCCSHHERSVVGEAGEGVTFRRRAGQWHGRGGPPGGRTGITRPRA